MFRITAAPAGFTCAKGAFFRLLESEFIRFPIAASHRKLRLSLNEKSGLLVLRQSIYNIKTH